MFIQTQNCRELRVVLHEPSLKMKELWGVRNGLAKPGVQPILSKVIYSVLLCVRSFDVVQSVGGDLECVLVMLERSFPHLFLYLFYLIKRNKSGNKQGLYQLKTLGSLNFIIIIITFYYYYYYYYIFLLLLFYLFTQLFII